MYLKVSSKKKGGEAIEIAPEDVALQTQGLEEHIPSVANTSKIDASHIHMQLAKDMFEADDRKGKNKNAPVRIERSWKVSSEEFIVKIDASPLHQSAARRMFDNKKQVPPTATTSSSPTLPSTAEGDETTTTATTETEPSEVHRSEWSEFWDNMSNLFFTGGGSSSNSSNNQK